MGEKEKNMSLLSQDGSPASAGKKTGAKKKLTPLMEQYFSIRENYPDAILLFQVGDFYELFFDDAVRASQVLAIALTKRGKHKGEDIPLCGVPLHAINHYLVKLVKNGFTVALCDQVSKPQPGTVVKRAVTRVYTPGTLTDAELLHEKSASYICSIALDREENRVGLLFTELLTAQLFATSCDLDQLRQVENELVRFFPDEVLVQSKSDERVLRSILSKGAFVTSLVTPENGYFGGVQDNEMYHRIKSGVGPGSGPGSRGVEQEGQEAGYKIPSCFTSENQAINSSFGTLYRYLVRNQPQALNHFKTVSYYDPEQFMQIDRATQKNLELVLNSEHAREHTLFKTIDNAQTAMGSRMLKKWLLRPLVTDNLIQMRHDVVELFTQNITELEKIRELLASFADIERIVGRIALQRAQAHDYITLISSLQQMGPLRQLLIPYQELNLLGIIIGRLSDFEELIDLLERSVGGENRLINPGFDQQLDRLYAELAQYQEQIVYLAQSEGEKYGIPSLKIGYTSVAGYYIEVTKTHVKKVPEHYVQTQTLANRARYMTTELKQLEQEIIQRQTDIAEREKVLFAHIEAEVRRLVSPLRQAAHALATLDVLVSFAHTAHRWNYCRPQFNTEGTIEIHGGRHPVVEQVSRESSFVPNDTCLSREQLLWVITGPNMGGKSTYLRQVALISLLAQCGSFIPATEASLPIIDRIFTRIGAGDNVAQGKSTFLVEMEETATICAQATERSLVILDEVGRGTSTDDGRALAQAIIEYLVSTVKARTLFATHYHELTELAEQSSAIQNYYLQSVKRDGKLFFLHTLASGVAHTSFGIDVAQLAQLPNQVIDRARQLIDQQSPRLSGLPVVQNVQDNQEKRHENQDVLDMLEELDVENLSPRQAFDLIWNLKKKMR